MKNKILLMEYIKKIVEQEVEAGKDSPFGQYLFGPNRKDLKGTVNEPNTPLEDMVFQNLMGHYAGSKTSSNNLAMDFFTLKSLLDKGYYKKLLSPPQKKLYRLISFNSLSLNDFNFNKKDFENERIKVYKGGTLKPANFNSPIQSWTVDFNKNFFQQIVGIGGSKNLYPGDGIAVFIVNSPKNNFILNPNLPKYLSSTANLKKSGVDLEQEKEVISVGPVSYDKVVAIYNPENIKDESGNVVENEKILKMEDYWELLNSRI